MKIISWNVNGIRASIKKGFWDWFDAQKADIVCLQETKITAKDFHAIAREHDLTPLVPDANALELDIESLKKRKKPIYYALACAEKKGYSGVAILCREKPKKVEIGLGDERFDNEGRTLIADFGDFSLVNVYVPNGSRDLVRIPYKMEFSDFMLERLQKMRKKQKNIVICGDMNVAHAEIDIKNPKSNQKNSGFTPIEREWFTKFLDHKYIDTFRHFHPEKRDQYSWWSYRPGVREKNIGWRIDYFVTTDNMIKKVKKAEIHMNQQGSDHCPISIVL